MINYDRLKPKLPASVIAELPTIIEKSNITTANRLAHFLSQCSHESGGFTVLRENLNYSADGLRRVFPKYFPTPEIAAQFARQPEKIANKVYASRMGNGAEASGDGYKFRGRGFIQLTGHDNYKAFGTFLNEDILSNPDLVATKYPLLSAAFFFNRNNLWTICDQGDSDAVIKSLTKRINGGFNGLEDRIAKFRLYKPLIS